MPQMIEAGKVYKAVPPLYSIGSGKKITYFTKQIDIVRYNQKLFMQKHKLVHIGKEKKSLTNREVTVLFMKNVDYIYELERISTTYAMDPKLLEMVLISHYNKTSIASLKKKVKSTYRFMDINKKNGVDSIEGTIDKYYKLYITDKLIEDCKLVLDIIKENDSTAYILDGKEASLYEIMKVYEGCSPSSLQRYKGLGEMDVEELAESTTSPYASRTLVQYTIEDAKEEIEAIRVYESDMSKLLTMVGTVSREDLLD